MTMNAQIPMRWVGPIRFSDGEQLEVPLATYETTLFPSVARGALASYHSQGITTTLHHDFMTRSVCLRAPSHAYAHSCVKQFSHHHLAMEELTRSTSRFAQFIDLKTQIIGKQLFIRFHFHTADASGHNMATLAAETLTTYLLQHFAHLEYVSLSGNMCTDKKVSSVNHTLGRGKSVTAEMTLSQRLCKKILKTTPQALAELNIQKNYLGSLVAGSLHSANAHYANILLALYLATGQDGANIVEGSQGYTTVEVEQGDLYISVNLPNLIVGTLGHGKDAAGPQQTLERLGCKERTLPGRNSQRLAKIIAATTLCGELSLLAALTNPHELMKGHKKYERHHVKPASRN